MHPEDTMMLAKAQKNYAVQNSVGRESAPLTVEVLSTLENAQMMASEIVARLYQLRDRLLGSEPTSIGANGLATQAIAPHFKAAHSEKSSSLIGTLAEIDRLSLALANSL